jgi:GGDEF domain-containing protein
MRQFWAGIAVGLIGTAAGVGAAIGGQPLGLLAALACLVGGAMIVVAARRAQAAVPMAGLVELIEPEVLDPVDPVQPGTWDASAGPETVVDPETGLLDHRIFAVTFERKVAAARRHLRPLSLVLIDIAAGLPAEEERLAALAAFGATVTRTLRESDVPCRVGDTTFGLILEDTAEPGGVWVAERLQIAAACSASAFVGPMRAAVATYPNHGLKAEEVLSNASAALARAVSQPAVDGDRFAPVEVPAQEF